MVAVARRSRAQPRRGLVAQPCPVPLRVQGQLPEVAAGWRDRLRGAGLVAVVRLPVPVPARVPARVQGRAGPREPVRPAFARPGTQRSRPPGARALRLQALELARARRLQEYTST